MCGMTQIQDVEYALELGVDALGFIFYSNSSRNISIEKAKKLTQNIPAFVDVVAVLVNSEKEFIHRLVNELSIQYLQFHGDEDVQFCNQFNKPYIKAIRPLSAEQIQQSALEFSQASAILLDTPSQQARGGTGETFDWQIIPKEVNKAYILAGGLNENNVVDAVKLCRPHAVDVCSGVEISPGIKDHQKMSRFVKALWG
nr:phosphoribosylanthranilate isomerase [Legionella waltersii]